MKIKRKDFYLEIPVIGWIIAGICYLTKNAIDKQYKAKLDFKKLEFKFNK